MPEVGKEGRGCPGTEERAVGSEVGGAEDRAGGQEGPSGGLCLTAAALDGALGSPWAAEPEDLTGSAGKR